MCTSLLARPSKRQAAALFGTPSSDLDLKFCGLASLGVGQRTWFEPVDVEA